MKLRYLLIISALIIIGTFGQVANAQGIPDTSDLNLSVVPENPAPGQSITITAVSYLIDLQGSNITWTINGVVKKKGIAITSLTTTAPAFGKTLTVKVTAVSTNNKTLTSTVVVTAGTVDMITESDGYVPPFFSGRVPLSYQNKVRIIAIPHLSDASGKEYNPATLIYKWSRDTGTVLADQSGYGKQFIELKGTVIPRPYTLTVDVSSRDGSANTQGSVYVTTKEPFLTFYENDPLYGPFYNSAVNKKIYIGSQKETSVVASLFGFNKPLDDLGNISLVWSINGISHSELNKSNNVVLRAPDGVSGSSDVSLTVRNNKEILQGADGVFSAIFRSSTSTPSSNVSF